MQTSHLGTANRSAYVPPALSKAALSRRIGNLSRGRVLVFGDLLIDELLEGKPERISREAPVLILEHVETQLMPGGAANTANNIAALGGTCCAVGVCGRDQYAASLAGLFEKAGIRHALVEDTTRPTTVKTRILSKSHSFKQQLLRLDRICHDPVSAHIEQLLVEKLAAVAVDYQAVVLSDYRGGVVSDATIAACLKVAAQHGLKVIVDAQNGFQRFQGVSLITPNQPDTEAAVGYAIDSPAALERAGADLLRATGAASVLITRGAEGMALFSRDGERMELPVFSRSEVFDVSGAGDTVVATMALALVTGAGYDEAMALGNLAAGIVVTKPGTATTDCNELLQALEDTDLPS